MSGEDTAPSSGTGAAREALLDLLWIRSSWGLQPSGDVPPPPEVVPVPVPTTQSLRRDKREWEATWSELWRAVLAHLGRPYRSGAFEEMRASEPGSDERRRLRQAMIGPSWHDRFGTEGFDERHEEWTRSISRDRRRDQRRSLEDDPERRSLDSTITAWERGLETIVTIPCTGEYTRTITATALCVTRATRSDPDRYGRARRSFGR